VEFPDGRFVLGGAAQIWVGWHTTHRFMADPAYAVACVGKHFAVYGG